MKVSWSTVFPLSDICRCTLPWVILCGNSSDIWEDKFVQGSMEALYFLLTQIYKVRITLTPTAHPLPVAVERDGQFCRPITCGSSGICLRGTDWPHERSFAASNLNIPWHVAPAPTEYNSSWLASSAGRHDSGLSSTVHHCGPGASWEEGGACYPGLVNTGDLDEQKACYLGGEKNNQ